MVKEIREVGKKGGFYTNNGQSIRTMANAHIKVRVGSGLWINDGIDARGVRGRERGLGRNESEKRDEKERCCEVDHVLKWIKV